MVKSIAVSVLVVLALVATAAAQEKPTGPKDKPATKATKAETVRSTEPPAQPVNIKIEVSITDQTASGSPAKKVVTVIAADHQATSVRSTANVPVRSVPNGPMVYRSVIINVDARPAIVAKEPNRVLVSFGLEYLPKSGATSEETEAGMAQLNERLSLILDSGKPMIVSQAADPTSDRKITVEVTATILK